MDRFKDDEGLAVKSLNVDGSEDDKSSTVVDRFNVDTFENNEDVAVNGPEDIEVVPFDGLNVDSFKDSEGLSVEGLKVERSEGHEGLTADGLNVDFSKFKEGFTVEGFSVDDSQEEDKGLTL